MEYACGQWREVELPVTDPTLFSVSFADSNRGWIGGHDRNLLSTEDGGQTWMLHDLPDHIRIEYFAATSESTLWVRPAFPNPIEADTVLYRSTDAGTSWHAVLVPISFRIAYQGVSFVSDMGVKAALEFFGISLWTTSDAGEIWEEVGLLPSGTGGPWLRFFDESVEVFGNSAGGPPNPTVD